MFKCYHNHKALPLGENFFILGGNCESPCREADVFVGLDNLMEENPVIYPWTEKEGVYFYIPDMSVPRDVIQFDNLIDWIIDKIKLGKIVHVGCLGGHGRTGMVLSAIVYKMLGIEDAITYVRDNYCSDAVETQEQIEWLNKVYNITIVESALESYMYLFNRDLSEMNALEQELDEEHDFKDTNQDEIEFDFNKESSLNIFENSFDKKLFINKEHFNSIIEGDCIQNLGQLFKDDEEKIHGIVVKKSKENEKTMFLIDLYYSSAYLFTGVMFLDYEGNIEIQEKEEIFS